MASRILVVDDDAAVSASLVALLEQRGYQIEVCSDVATATRMLSDGLAFDIALLDVRLEQDDGRRIVDHVREQGIATQCLMISGEDSVDTAVDALRRGARDYLRKPFSPEELFHRIESALESSKLKRENRAVQQRLHESEHLHRFLVNSSPDLVFMLDESGDFSYVSDKLLATLHFSDKELLGQPFFTLSVPDDVSRAEHLLNQADDRNATHSVELLLRSGDDSADPRSHMVMLAPVSSVAEEGSQDATAVRGYYGIARDISEQKQAEALITYQATHDLLTRLPNRALFKDLMSSTLSMAKRTKSGFAVCYMDLDRFKGINDSLGHSAGDELLRTVASRMRATLRESDTVARIGGDEFTILLPDITTVEQCDRVAEKLASAVAEPINIDGHELHVTTSIGIAMYPQHGSSSEELERHADIAMYAVKNDNRNGHKLFSASMGEINSQRYLIEQQLRNALQQDELHLHYQPQINTRTGAIECMEALVRWNHPQLGMLYPGDFIPIAEECGLIMDIDRWVLSNACRELSGWIRAGAPGMRVAVNFSAQQFSSPDMVDFVLRVLESTGISGQQLEIEITETDILRDLQSVTAQLLELAEHGVKVALDDFGVGYASLNYIRNLPVHKVKIDRSFVHDVTTGTVDGSIVKAIVKMAQGMHMLPIAEGVENRDQVEFLTSIGCTGMQGYYFGHPTPADQAAALLNLPAAGTA